MTCSTCKFWRDGVEPVGERLCKPVGWKECHLASANAESALDSLSSNAFFVGGYEHPSLATGPEFGCIHHEPKL